MEIKHCDFSSAIKYLTKESGIRLSNTHIKPPFNGFYKNVNKGIHNKEEDDKVYSEDDLPSKSSLSKRFIDDNISATTQEKWGVRYCHDNDSILIPVKSENGDIVGCKARSNKSNIPKSKRWWAFLNYSKTHFVYGMYENYKNIIQNKTVYVFESEKSVLQCDSFDVNNAVAIGGHSFSQRQSRLIKSLMCKEIIVAFDEGLTEEEVAYEAKKLKMNNSIICNKVGYIWDDKNEILPKNSKCSPSDLGKREFKRLVKEKVKWI